MNGSTPDTDSRKFLGDKRDKFSALSKKNIYRISYTETQQRKSRAIIIKPYKTSLTNQPIPDSQVNNCLLRQKG